MANQTPDSDALKQAMADEMREVLGAGFVPDYYTQFAAGFVDIALHHANQAVKSALAKYRRKMRKRNG